ncbi:unnamed protein product [Durusdinium trenchii]|uniref:Calcineurin-like phosphoesterase domain-containing protein n=1 Tax=Durusdinium trenchii TaxID=1381693 RepID=A0ABP0SNQ7_9DINO
MLAVCSWEESGPDAADGPPNANISKKSLIPSVVDQIDGETVDHGRRLELWKDDRHRGSDVLNLKKSNRSIGVCGVVDKDDVDGVRQGAVLVEIVPLDDDLVDAETGMLGMASGPIHEATPQMDHVHHLEAKEKEIQVQDEDRAAESVEGEWCRRQAVVHHEVHVEQHQTVDPDADWKGRERVVGVVETLVVSSCGAVAVVPGCGMGVGGVGTVAGIEIGIVGAAPYGAEGVTKEEVPECKRERIQGGKATQGECSNPFASGWYKVLYHGCSEGCLEMARQRLASEDCKDRPMDDTWIQMWDDYLPTLAHVLGSGIYQSSAIPYLEALVAAMKLGGCATLKQPQFRNLIGTQTSWCEGDPELVRPLAWTCPESCDCTAANGPAEQPSDKAVLCGVHWGFTSAREEELGKKEDAILPPSGEAWMARFSSDLDRVNVAGTAIGVPGRTGRDPVGGRCGREDCGTTRSKATDSRRSRPWHWLTILAGCRVARVSRVARRFRVFGISDVHTDWDENLRQLEELPVGPYSEDALLLAGDVSHDFQKVSQTLQLLKQRFKYLFFVPGNHDLYVRHEDGVDSLVKHERLLNECARLGVWTSPVRFKQEKLLIVPLLSWYHSEFDQEPNPSEAAWPSRQHSRLALLGDEMECRWPSLSETSAAPRNRALAELFDVMNDQQAAKVPQQVPEGVEAVTFQKVLERDADEEVISMSHFLPEPVLLPEKRFLFFPQLAEAAGSLFLQERVRALKPQLHLFGHTHFAWDQDFQERRYVSAPLGSPKEWRMRPRSMKLQGGARATRKDGRKEMWERSQLCFGAGLTETRSTRSPVNTEGNAGGHRRSDAATGRHWQSEVTPSEMKGQAPEPEPDQREPDAVPPAVPVAPYVRVIHQQYRTAHADAWPPEWRRLSGFWQRAAAHGRWRWRFWTDEEEDAKISQADLSTYAILYVHGGVYADMDAWIQWDTMPVGSLDAFLDAVSSDATGERPLAVLASISRPDEAGAELRAPRGGR